jgi:antitoxin ParD1/3/4
MAVRRTITVSITPEQHTFISQQLLAGRFGSVSEVMRAALRLLQEHEAGFQAHLDARTVPPRSPHAC